ncbi:MAG: histidine phosphatase family protein [Pseudomonadota bacterium]
MFEFWDAAQKLGVPWRSSFDRNSPWPNLLAEGCAGDQVAPDLTQRFTQNPLGLSNKRRTKQETDMIWRRAALTLLAMIIVFPALAQDNPRLIILRHADRVPGVLELNELGVARAAALPAALADLDIDAIFVSHWKRNIDSARPLATARDLPILVMPERHLSNGHLAREILKRQPSGTSVWIGNTGNLKDIWSELDLRSFSPTTYGEISIVEVRGNRGYILETRRFEPLGQ